MTIQPSNSSLMADAFCEALRQALIEIDAEDALRDLGVDAAWSKVFHAMQYLDKRVIEETVGILSPEPEGLDVHA
jgi:hypothetical protein